MPAAGVVADTADPAAGETGTNMKGNKRMFRIASRVALGLLGLAATQHLAAGQTTLVSALPVVGMPEPATMTTPDVPLAAKASVTSAPTASAAATSTVPTPMLVAQVPGAPGAPPNCVGVSPYDNYACLDAYLGDNFFERLYNYYKLEWGQAGPPTDPNAPPGRRADWPRTPATTPPMPFTEWPYGGTQNLGVTRPSSADSPLMAALGNTGLGSWMNDNHIQFYGWIDPGLNVSSNSVRPGGNAPVAYSYTPNTVQLDQLVLYLERVPDTVQDDHIDWGFRLSGIYGENYRYTTAYGVASYQLLKDNKVNGYDFPMMYGELFFPQLAPAGMLLRVGRFISLPDIEAQLAPNNYMYSHSMTYSFDNYTNQGIQTTWGLTKNFFIQIGASVGTEAAVWHWGATEANLMPGNALYSGNRFDKDPGAGPSGTGCFRLNWNDGWDNINGCADAINSGQWGYNNLQWYGLTAYHRFNDDWHISFETYDEHQNGVPNANNATAAGIVAAGGTPFSPQYVPFNAPGLAFCHNPNVLTCRAEAFGAVAYLNWQVSPLDNISFRPEFYDDMEGQRTGTKARYYDIGLGWQHWLSPQIEFRPEVVYYHSVGARAFNGDSNAGIAPDRNYTWIAQSDMIFHF
jgi:hypothetical protein